MHFFQRLSHKDVKKLVLRASSSPHKLMFHKKVFIRKNSSESNTGNEIHGDCWPPAVMKKFHT
jgi:hypothetical protein